MRPRRSRRSFPASRIHLHKRLPTPGAPVRLTLQDALQLARKNDPTYHAAVTEAGIAREDRAQSRDALLPGVNFTTSSLYTQTNANGVRFIANNAAHEYVSQGNVHQVFDLASFSSYRRSAALAAAAKARAEVASRGLVVTVVQNYFAVAAAEQKLSAARRTAGEGERFFAAYAKPGKGRRSGALGRHQGGTPGSGSPPPVTGSATRSPERAARPRRATVPGLQRQFRVGR